jgi:Mg/Co/Ni transporter MgtE
MVFYLYVVDERRHLVGVVSLRRLLLVSPETPLKRIMTTDLISVRVDMDQEEVARRSPRTTCWRSRSWTRRTSSSASSRWTT